MHYLYLLRHAQSQANADEIIAGSHESPLSATGRKQADFAGETAKLYLPPFDLIVSSPMQRAVETARIIANQIRYPLEKIVVLNELHERDLGTSEGKDYRLTPQYNGNYGEAENIPGIEPIQEFYDRTRAVFEKLKQRPEQRILLVCHNGTGRMLRVVTTNATPIEMYEQPRLENTVFYPLI